jgi:hypothetical protein
LRVNYRLFCWIALAGLTCAGQEKDPNAIWKKAGADDGLRQAFERVVYGLNDSGPGRLEGVNPAQRLDLEFNSDGARLKHPQGDAALRLTGYGYGERLRTPVKAKPAASGNRVEYERGELSEWYVNDSGGLEQGFTLARRPGSPRAGEPLVIALAVSGGLRPELTAQGDALVLSSNNNAVLRYAGLRAWDARGHALPSRLQVGEREVRLVVEDQGAEYPLVVDPVWTQQAKLTASNGAVNDYFGATVAVSGGIAVVGAYNKTIGPNAAQGAAYVFVQNGATWSLQEELTASDGAAGDEFGYAVAASGTTVMVGAPNKTVGSNQYQGAAYVFVQNGATWTQQTKLTSSDGAYNDVFGYSVALDANTAVVGANNKAFGSLNTSNVCYCDGAAYVFVRNGTTWSQQQKLLASDVGQDDGFGTSVAVSGNIAVIGAPFMTKQNLGAAYVFVQNGTTWSQQQELTASDGANGDHFGISVAVSGNTALIGAYLKTVGSNQSQGAAYVFLQSGSTWAQEQELTASDGGPFDAFGWSVALSGDTAVIGAVHKTFGSIQNQGAAYVFVGSGAAWSQQSELTSSDGAANDDFGSSVALDGETAVVGAPFKTIGSNAMQGAAYVFIETTTPSTYVYNDFAGNGRSGALLYDPSIGQSYTAMSNANGTYNYIPNLFTSHFDTLRTGDFNGDGKADLILYNSQTDAAYIGFGNGDGTFNFQSLFWSSGYNIVVTGDINGDGKTDVALYNSAVGTLYTGISNGDGTFTYEYHLVSQNFTYVKLADFNGDGKADLFLYRVSDGLAYLGIGGGTGGFTFNPLSISAGYNLADAGDLNGDGKEDIILYNATNGNAATGISNGSGFTFTPLIFSKGFTAVRLGDYTGHTTADVTVYNANTAIAYFGTGTGTGNFNFISLFWSPGYDSVIAEDVNADGKTDIVLYNSATGTEYTGISNGDGTFNYTYSYWGIGKLLAQ